ncbi:MAG: hypothetical protein Kow0077_23040 [Anaerolineae bacterium]
MTTYPGSPRLFRGAIVTLDGSRIARAIPFQYNPNTLSRTLEAQVIESQSGSGEQPRFSGAPVETIKVEIKLSAVDGLEQADDNAQQLGIYPQLAALETLLYPSSQSVKLNATLLKLGTIEIIPPAVPMTLFIWGVRRIVPVRITEYSVTEDYHTPELNPISATVSLGMRVLSYSDLATESTGWNLFLSHQIVKESLAEVAQANANTGTYQSLL